MSIAQPHEIADWSAYVMARSVQTEATEDEEAELRLSLSRKRLESLVAQQLFERQDDTFSRPCLFCRRAISGRRADLFEHMFHEHGFSSGHYANLVHVDLLLDMIQQRLDACQCIYCEKVFPDRRTLQGHMRKKKHCNLHPHNRTFDKFYISKYTVDDDRQLRSPQHSDEEDDSEVEDEVNEWEEDVFPGPVDCFLCERTLPSLSLCMTHLEDEHRFSDILKLIGDEYGVIKFINWCRTEQKRGVQVSATGPLMTLPDRREWDNVQFLMPVRGDDPLLMMSWIDGDDS
jgi:hypothetical protein